MTSAVPQHFTDASINVFQIHVMISTILLSSYSVPWDQLIAYSYIYCIEFETCKQLPVYN